MSVVLEVTTFGVPCCASRIIFAGSVRSEACAVGPGGQPVLEGGGGPGGGGGEVDFVTTAVCAESANVLPSPFRACTLKRIVLPTSTEVRVYVAECAPAMFAQEP